MNLERHTKDRLLLNVKVVGAGMPKTV